MLLSRRNRNRVFLAAPPTNAPLEDCSRDTVLAIPVRSAGSVQSLELDGEHLLPGNFALCSLTHCSKSVSRRASRRREKEHDCVEAQDRRRSPERWKSNWAAKIEPFLVGDVLEVGIDLGSKTLILRGAHKAREGFGTSVDPSLNQVDLSIAKVPAYFTRYVP